MILVERPILVRLILLLAFPVLELFIPGPAWAQTDTTMAAFPAPDTTAVDSLRYASLPIAGPGILRMDTTSLLSSHRFVWKDVFDVGTLLQCVPGTMVHTLGESGQPQRISYLGADARNLGATIDGQTLNDPVTGVFDPSSIPIEYISNAVLSSSPVAGAAAVLGSGTSLNFFTRQYVLFKPISKVRYLQGPYDHTFTDGLFSQNITRATNLTIGFQREVADGRYLNSSVDSWIFRSRVRFNFSDRLNAMVSYLYWKSSNGVNGGVFTDSTSSVYDDVDATVRLENAHATRARHSLLTAFAARVFPDTLWITRLQLFYASGDREYRDQEFAQWNPSGSYQWKSIGGSVEQTLGGSWYTITAGGRLEQRLVTPDSLFYPGTRTLAGVDGRVEFTLPGDIQPSVSFRYENVHSTSKASLGAGLAIPLSPWLTADVGYSLTYRYPTIQELSLASWIGGDPGEVPERHMLASAALQANLAAGTIRLMFYHRRTEDWRRFRVQGDLLANRYFLVVGEIVPSLRVTGAVLLADLHLWHFNIVANLNAATSEASSGPAFPAPQVSSLAELAWRDDYFDGSLEMRAGIRARAWGIEPPVYYQPAMDLFAQAASPRITNRAQFDLFGVFHIGDAFVQLTWENFTNARYYLIPTYPALDSNFKVGINWLFFN